MTYMAGVINMGTLAACHHNTTNMPLKKMLANNFAGEKTDRTWPDQKWSCTCSSGFRKCKASISMSISRVTNVCV